MFTEQTLYDICSMKQLGLTNPIMDSLLESVRLSNSVETKELLNEPKGQEQFTTSNSDDILKSDKFTSRIFKDENNNTVELWNEDNEQLQAELYITPDSVVLELGARYGMVSCIINNKISDRRNQVSVEPDYRVHKCLKTNMIQNKCNFHILEGVISKKPISLCITNSSRDYSARTVISESPSVPSYTFEEVETMYNLKFNTLVADCEGFLEQFFDENPFLYDQLNLIILEKDCPENCDYNKIINTMKLHNFICVDSRSNGFHEVWKKKN
jgi:FkbM family methyltransferase